MSLTVPELARAVGKKENYVRQHIHRRHLIVRKKGRRIAVELNDAVQWAASRGLTLTPPDRLRLTLAREEGRVARLTVLARVAEGGEGRNLFTLLRHRDREALGPWSGGGDAAWFREELDEGIQLFLLNGSFAECRSYVDRILTSGNLCADGTEIQYAVEDRPRKHWAYRDYRHRPDASMRSPFATHSATMTEYWSFAHGAGERWLRLSDPLSPRLQAGLRRLGFPLDQCPERAGNLLVASAEDAITCKLTAHQDQMLRLHVEAKDLLSESYRATVWASHSGDEVLRREVPVNPGQTRIEVASEVDRTGFAVCRNFDGQCVDLVESVPSSQMRRMAGRRPQPAPRVRGRQRRSAPRASPHAVAVSVFSDDGGGSLDGSIRQRWLHRVAHQREAGARREANLVRFGPGRFEEAAQHFLRLLAQSPGQTGPIYLADPCFVGHTMADGVARLFVDMCAAIQRRPLRILCAERAPDGGPPWWARQVQEVAASVTVRTFVNRCDDRGCFHDRYLITPTHEFLMTNSFNGWNRYGVTFVSLPYGVYRAEAEELWAMDPESPGPDILVREIS